MSDYSYEKKFDVVIVGGGVIGCSIAYFLARETKGKMKIAVLERNTIGEGASKGAAGMLAAQTESDSGGPFLDLAIESRNSFEQLAPELKLASGVDIVYLKSGIFSLALNPTQEKALKAKLKWQKKSGLAGEWISSEAAQRKFPFLNLQSSGALWIAEDGQVSSKQLVTAFAESAKKMGVNFFENESFDALQLQPPQLNFLETDVSKFVAEQFVFAAGAWTGKLLNNLVRIEPVKGQILIFQIPPAEKELQKWEIPVFCGQTPEPEPISCYFVPKKDGHLLLGATVEKRGFDKSENQDATKKLLKYGCKIFPKLSSFKLKAVWTGLRPATPDYLPVLGCAPGFKNVYVASGHFRNGILLAPVTGKIFSELILNGRSTFPIQSFSPERFL